MEKLLSVSQKRYLELIDFFIRNKTFWVPIDYIVDKLDTNEDTLLQDLSSLSQYGAYFVRNDDEIRFAASNSVSSEEIYRNFFNSVPALDIIEEIFFTPGLNNEDLAQRLGISASTLYRYVNNLNSSLLKRFNIQIESRPYHFVGDEKEIRHFLCEYFAEKYAVFEWPFSSEEAEQLAEEIIINYAGLLMSDDPDKPYNLDFSYMFYAKTVLAVSAIRTLQGYTIPNTLQYYPRVDTILKNLDQIKQAKYTLKRFSEISGLEIEYNFDILGQMFSVFFQQEFYLNIDSFLEDAKYNPYTQKSYRLLKDIIEHFADNYQVKMSDIDKLIFHAHNSNHLYNARLFVDAILYDRKELVVSQWRQSKSEIIDRIANLSFQYREEMGLPNKKSLDNFLVYSFVTRWPELYDKICKNTDVYSILVCSIYDDDAAEGIAKSSRISYPYQADVTVNYDRNLTYEKLVNSSYDVIVADFEIPQIKGKKIVNIYSPNNILAIQDAFLELSQERRLNNNN